MGFVFAWCRSQAQFHSGTRFFFFTARRCRGAARGRASSKVARHEHGHGALDGTASPQVPAGARPSLGGSGRLAHTLRPAHSSPLPSCLPKLAHLRDECGAVAHDFSRHLQHRGLSRRMAPGDAGVRGDVQTSLAVDTTSVWYPAARGFPDELSTRPRLREPARALPGRPHRHHDVCLHGPASKPVPHDGHDCPVHQG